MRQSGRMAPGTHTSGGGVMRRVTGSRGKAFETDEPADSIGRKFLLPVLAILAVASMILAIMATMAMRASHRELAEVRAGLATARVDIARAHARIASAGRRASEVFAQAKLIERGGLQAKKDAGQIKLREEKKLHEIYPKLRRLEMGINRIDDRYLKEFDYSKSKTQVTLVGKYGAPFKPHFAITFLNKEGAVTQHLPFTWLATEIGPGETRRDEQVTRPLLGDPVYYFVTFYSY
jgi:hypothetical protein